MCFEMIIIGSLLLVMLSLLSFVLCPFIIRQSSLFKNYPLIKLVFCRLIFEFKSFNNQILKLNFNQYNNFHKMFSFK